MAQVNTADMIESLEHVFARLQKHARLQMKLHFKKEVAEGKSAVDLDFSLIWLTDSFKASA